MSVNTNNTSDDASNADNNLSDLTRRESLDFYDNALDNINQLSRDARIRIAETLSTMPAWYSPTLKTSRLGMARATPDFILNREIQSVLDDNTNGVREQLAEVLAAEGVGFSSLYQMKRRGAGRLGRLSNVDGNRVDWLIRNPYSPEGQMLLHLYGQLWTGNQDRLQDAFDRVDDFDIAKRLHCIKQVADAVDVLKDPKYENIGEAFAPHPGSKIAMENIEVNRLKLERENLTHNLAPAPGGTPDAIRMEQYKIDAASNAAGIAEYDEKIGKARERLDKLANDRTELRGHMDTLVGLTGNADFRTTLGVTSKLLFPPDSEGDYKHNDAMKRSFFTQNVTINTFMNPGGTTHALSDWITNREYRGAVNRLIRQEKRSGIRELDPKGVLDEMVRMQIESGAIEEGQREQVISQFQGLATSRKEIPKDAQIGTETAVTPVAQQEKKARFGWVKKAAKGTGKATGRFLSGMLGMREPKFGGT